jgi:2-polyprenyl-3-methyl-5-hydroxy-6-metoxy-1,4-benzoquinol methylase
MKLDPVICALCGGADLDLVFTVPSLRLRAQNLYFDIRKCRRCGLALLSPRPTADVMAALYQPQHYSAPHHDLVRRLEKLILRERVTFVRKYTNQTSRLLDIGCGNGGFLTAMAEAGHDVHGLEPYQDALAGTPKELRSRIRCEPFESANYPEGSFDIITLWHVLEHLERPTETLRSIRKFLKPGGILILEVPNFASREAGWLGPYWYNLDAPYHFWHFTPETLRAAIEQTGFQSPVCVTSAITRPVWLLNYLLLGASAAAEKWQAQHPAWRNWPRTTTALGFLLCFGSRVLFANSCPMLRLVCHKSA